MTKLIILFIISLWCLSGFCSDRKETNKSAGPKKNWIDMWNTEKSSASTSASKSVNEPSTSKYLANSNSATQSSSADSKLYTCTDCNLQYRDYSNLWQHKRSKHDNEKYVCSICYRKFTYPSNLDRHTKSIHEGIKYECSTCSQKFTQSGHLNEHKRTKHEGVEYVCPICNKKYATSSSFNAHKKNSHKLR